MLLSFLLFIVSCFIQALEWIHDNGEFYLSTHTSTGSSIHHTQELLKEHEEFQITAKVNKEQQQVYGQLHLAVLALLPVSTWHEMKHKIAGVTLRWQDCGDLA